MNLSIHANHIVIAFIHNQEHALSVALVYAIVLLLNAHALRIIAQHFVRNCKKYFDEILNKWHYMFFFLLLFLAISIILDGLFSFVAAIYVIIPINNAFDEAPARIRLIYDSLIVAFFGYISFISKRTKNQM